VETVLTVKEVRTRSVCYGFVFRRKEGGEIVAKGEVVAVHASVHSSGSPLQACPMPEQLRRILLERCVNT
jgi:acyl-CoA thioesterase FadM